MAYLDSTDLIARVRKQARIQGQTDFPTDPQLFEWLTDGENFVKAIVATYCPRALITAPVLMTTADGGLTYQYGADASGNAVIPFGQVNLFRQLADIPDFPLEPEVDFLDEGTQIRSIANVATTTMYPSGAPYFQGMVPTTLLSSSASTQPTIVPADKRQLSVYYACAEYAAAGGAFDPTPYVEQPLDGGKAWPSGMTAWVKQLQLQYANRGILGATRSSPAVGARLRRIANTRMWPYR